MPDLTGYKLIHQNQRYKYYVSKDGKLLRNSKNSSIELGYIDDNMQLYKKLCESV